MSCLSKCVINLTKMTTTCCQNFQHTRAQRAKDIHAMYNMQCLHTRTHTWPSPNEHACNMQRVHGCVFFLHVYICPVCNTHVHADTTRHMSNLLTPMALCACTCMSLCGVCMLNAPVPPRQICSKLIVNFVLMPAINQLSFVVELALHSRKVTMDDNYFLSTQMTSAVHFVQRALHAKVVVIFVK